MNNYKFVICLISILFIISCKKDNYEEFVLVEGPDPEIETTIILDDKNGLLLPEVEAIKSNEDYLIVKSRDSINELSLTIPLEIENLGGVLNSRIKILDKLGSIKEFETNNSECQDFLLIILEISDQFISGEFSGSIYNNNLTEGLDIEGSFNAPIVSASKSYGSMQGTVWYDVEGNDVIDSNENGINGIKLKLLKLIPGSICTGEKEFEVIDSLYSGHKPNSPGEDGYFKFHNIETRYMYSVEIQLPPYGLVTVNPNIGLNDELDSEFYFHSTDGEYDIYRTDIFYLDDGEDLVNLNCGFRPE